MSEPGDKLTRAYRDLAREEPPPALDRAILAASQRALRRPSLARLLGPQLVGGGGHRRLEEGPLARGVDALVHDKPGATLAARAR